MFRMELKMTQEEMAECLIVSQSFYNMIESAQRNPSYNFLEKFHDKFPNADINYIFFE